jgi:hypothetical protein
MIRRLRDDEPVPSSAPRRYRGRGGYIILRWKVGVRTYVEVLEHRIVAGRHRPHVHHRNHQRDDNRPDNLAPLSALEHGAEHSCINIEEATGLYYEGWSLKRLASKYGVHPVTLMRGLKRRGLQPRSISEGQLIQRPVDEVRLRELWAAGCGTRTIAKVLGETRIVIRDRMRRLGLPRRRAGRPTKHDPMWAYLNGEAPLTFVSKRPEL